MIFKYWVKPIHIVCYIFFPTFRIYSLIIFLIDILTKHSIKVVIWRKFWGVFATNGMYYFNRNLYSTMHFFFFFCWKILLTQKLLMHNNSFNTYSGFFFSSVNLGENNKNWLSLLEMLEFVKFNLALFMIIFSMCYLCMWHESLFF